MSGFFGFNTADMPPLSEEEQRKLLAAQTGRKDQDDTAAASSAEFRNLSMAAKKDQAPQPAFSVGTGASIFTAAPLGGASIWSAAGDAGQASSPAQAIWDNAGTAPPPSQGDGWTDYKSRGAAKMEASAAREAFENAESFVIPAVVADKQNQQTQLASAPAAAAPLHIQPPVQDTRFTNMMTDYDRNFILRIQMQQITTGNPYEDDYYYHILNQKQQSAQNAARGEQGDTAKDGELESSDTEGVAQEILPPAMINRKREFAAKTFENTLGRTMGTSIKAPRALLDVRAPLQSAVAESSESTSNQRKRREILDYIESLFTQIIEATNLKRGLRRDDADLNAKLELLRGEYNHLGLAADGKPSEKLASILAIAKGRLAVARLGAILHPTALGRNVLVKMVKNLDICAGSRDQCTINMETGRVLSGPLHFASAGELGEVAGEIARQSANLVISAAQSGLLVPVLLKLLNTSKAKNAESAIESAMGKINEIVEKAVGSMGGMSTYPVEFVELLCAYALVVKDSAAGPMKAIQAQKDTLSETQRESGLVADALGA
eukprot:Clim_evm58s146 gene=Clim_evmTU58s146